MLLVTLAAGCDGTSNEPAGAGEPTAVALVVPTGASVVEVGWVVQAADGSTLASGIQDLAAPQDTLSLNLLLPVGHGDVLYLNALTATGTTCTGASDPFDVIAGAPAALKLSMICQTTDDAPAGCPQVLVQGPTPSAATAPNGTVSVVATAPGGASAPTFSWVATGGTFRDTTAGSTLYTCTTPGAQTIFLTVTAASCSATFLLPVICR